LTDSRKAAIVNSTGHEKLRGSQIVELTSVSLPADLAAFVHEQVDRGSFPTEEEVVVAALSLLRDHEELRRIRLERLKAKIQPALDRLDRGEGVPLDMQDIKDEISRRLAEEGKPSPWAG
jgi:putative addiction module CopG family antidote